MGVNLFRNKSSKFSYFFYQYSPSPYLQTPTQASISTSHLKTAGIIEKRLPATTPQGRAEQIGTGRAHGQSEGERWQLKPWEKNGSYPFNFQAASTKAARNVSLSHQQFLRGKSLKL